MRVLVDTNILARIAQPAHRHYARASDSVDRLLARNDDPCIVPQVLYEFWVVATRPASENGLAMSVSDTQAEVAKVRRIFSFLRDERAIFEQWERLVGNYQVKGKNAHDARLAAAAIRHGISTILTFNAADFDRFQELTVLTPDRLLEETTH